MLARLSEMESTYSNIERELLGVVFAVTHFKHFTYGRPVNIISDHKPRFIVQEVTNKFFSPFI